METYVSLLQTYGGRDKILRTTGYVASLLSGHVKNEETAKKLVTVSRQISNSRVVLRFFDDILMWRITRHCSVEEDDRYARICSILSNISIQSFFPFEHISWLSDHNVLSTGSFFGTGATVCWALSLFFNILRCLRKIVLLKRKRQQIKHQRHLESPDKSGEAERAYQTALRKCDEQEVTESWTLLKNAADFVIAINALPWRPFLWAGKFQPSRSAAFGTISSLVGLHLLIQAERKAKSII